jgi:hypothetical protein
MRGEQIAAELCRLGYNAVCCKPNELSKIKDSIIIWVRRVYNVRKLKMLTNNGNYQILDILDRLFENDLSKGRIIGNINAVLFASKTTIRQYRNNPELTGKDKYWVLHHYDPQLKYHEYNNFNLGYWGYRTSALNVNNFIPYKYRIRSARSGKYPPDYWFNDVSCHYSVRDYQRGLGWRPATKIATAAACGANIIVSRDKISEELLPDDYPYFLDNPGYDETEKMIEYARETFNTGKWKYGLKCMGRVRKLTNIKRCAKLYARIIDDIEARYF